MNEVKIITYECQIMEGAILKVTYLKQADKDGYLYDKQKYDCSFKNICPFFRKCPRYKELKNIRRF